MSANEVIRNHIADHGMKQSFVAERAGIPPELFSRSLKGERKIPADEFVAICSVLSLDIRDFQENREPATQTA